MNPTTLLLLPLLALLLPLTLGDRVTFLNITKTPRADTFNTKHDSPAMAQRGLKIHVEWMSKHDQRGVGESVRTLVSKLVGEATEFFKRALKLRHPIAEEGILLARYCEHMPGTGTIFADTAPIQPACPDRCSFRTPCGSTIFIPEHMLRYCTKMSYPDMVLTVEDVSEDYFEPTQPVDADFILFVNIADTPSCLRPDEISNSSFCQQDLTTYRPIAGYMTFCPNHELMTASNYELLLSKVKHSLIHMLGFNLNVLALSPDLNGFNYQQYSESNEPRLPFKSLSKNNKNEDNQPIWYFKPSENFIRRSDNSENGEWLISSPKVLSVAQGYFGCPSLRGLPIESQGGLDFAESHWESRVMPEELMSMAEFGRKKLSNFTLALLEDTGWYDANYEVAEELSFGRNAGCDFLQPSCSDLVHKFPQYFCHSSFDTCDYRMTVKSECGVIQYSQDIPRQYQVLNPKRGGQKFSDYCPQIQPKQDLNTYCTSSESSTEAEEFSENSRCISKNSNSCGTSLECHDITCNADNYVIEALSVTCRYEGEAITLSDDGTCSDAIFSCPPCELMCADCSQFPTTPILAQLSYASLWNISFPILLIGFAALFL